MPPRKTPVNPGNRRGRVKTGPTDVKLLGRRALAVELRRSGLSFDRVAEQVKTRYPGTPAGYDRASAYRDVMFVLRALIEEPGREVIAGELSRLDAALTAIWVQVRRGDLLAIDRMIKIMDQRAKYLGLYSPVQHQFTGPDGGPVQVANVTDPDEVFKIATAALSQAVADFRERQEPRALEAPA
jgi:hypothetical protein